MAAEQTGQGRLVAQNRRAFHDYAIEERFEAGVMLTGPEVKSLRQGRGAIAEAHAGDMRGELWLFNAHIPEYGPARHVDHETRRPRKLLLHKREIQKLLGAVRRQGYTLVPLKLYFNRRGLAKVELGLARGKKLHDKRQSIKDRDWKRDQQRLLRQRGKDVVD